MVAALYLAHCLGPCEYTGYPNDKLLCLFWQCSAQSWRGAARPRVSQSINSRGLHTCCTLTSHDSVCVS